MSQPEIPVLDRGFVRLIDHMGTDLTVVNAARVSFGKKAAPCANSGGNYSNWRCPDPGGPNGG